MEKLPLVWHPEYTFEFSDKHRFPMSKFGLLHQRVLSSELASDVILHDHHEEALADEIALAHCPDYVKRFANNELDTAQMRRIGMPWSEGLRRRTFLSPRGTIETVKLALQHGIGCHLAGGTHHGHYDFGSGYCIFNDLAVASRYAVESLGVDRVLIFDLDVHQGDGTAAILEGDENIATVSIHGAKNFPARKATSDIDVGVADGMKDEEYLELVTQTLNLALNSFTPDLVIYDAGVDIYVNDPLGRLAVSLQGIAARDQLVLSACKARGIPVATVIGGGYDDDREALVERHFLVVDAAHRVFIKGIS